MRRYTGVRILTQAMTSSDVGIFIGEDICREAKPYVGHEGNLFLSDETDYLLSLALGMCMCTDKRIFIFCEDQYFIKNLSESMHMGVSKCKNLYVVLFVNGRYTSVEDAPLVFDSINSQHGVLYNLGFLVHDYTRIFANSKNPIKEIRSFWERTRGPLAVVMKTTRGNKEMPEVEMDTESNLKQVSEFIQDKSIIAFGFDPPIPLEELNLEV